MKGSQVLIFTFFGFLGRGVLGLGVQRRKLWAQERNATEYATLIFGFKLKNFSHKFLILIEGLAPTAHQFANAWAKPGPNEKCEAVTEAPVDQCLMKSSTVTFLAQRKCQTIMRQVLHVVMKNISPLTELRWIKWLNYTSRNVTKPFWKIPKFSDTSQSGGLVHFTCKSSLTIFGSLGYWELISERK